MSTIACKRTYKQTKTCCFPSVNGGNISGMAYFDKTTLYPNQYMTLSLDGYTKHYFMGAERFCTTIGGGNDGHWLIYPIDNLTSREKDILMDLEDSEIYQHDYYDCYDYPQHQSHTINTDYTGTITHGDMYYPNYQYDKEENYYGDIGLFFKGASLEEDVYKYYHSDNGDNPYYYHSDHLGSAAWITDAKGLPVQYIMYAPYGEERLNQHPFSYRERFTFTGKERDAETGYDYFGARNYLSALSIWGAVDPFADKYIYNSPYVYCEGNPIRFIDPDGCFSIENIDNDTNYETILILPSESVLNTMGNNERLAFDKTREQAHSVSMPTIYVDNAQDYADAMAELGNMNSSTNSYVLATSHGYKRSDISGIMIGTDMYTNMSGDLSALCLGLVDKTVFITACALTSSDAGIDLIRRFALQTGADIIGSDYSIPAYLGGLRGGDLNMSPNLNAFLGLFGGNYHNSFQLTDGTTTNTIYNLTIDKNKGIRWNGGNKSIFSR